ncbi:MAG: hypothetical protein ACRD0K_16990 [Egibacteraceae bacterium]
MWEASARDQGALLGRVTLAEAEQWLADRPAEISRAEQHFIRASRARHRRAIRRLQALTAAVTVIWLVAAVLTVEARQLNRRVRDNAILVNPRTLADEA